MYDFLTILTKQNMDLPLVDKPVKVVYQPSKPRSCYTGAELEIILCGKLLELAGFNLVQVFIHSSFTSFKWLSWGSVLKGDVLNRISFKRYSALTVCPILSNAASGVTNKNVSASLLNRFFYSVHNWTVEWFVMLMVTKGIPYSVHTTLE